MGKEKGFANFTPEEAEEFKKQEKKNTDPYAGEQEHKDRQKAKNKIK